LDEEKKRQLSDYSIQLFERLECRDYARFDFRADEQGNIKLLEVNPNPGWCWDGKLCLMAGFGGLRYAEMLRLILQAGLDRIGNDGFPKNQEVSNTQSRDLQSCTLGSGW
jgi:D-alanine-D-alanine ligase